MSRRRPNRWIQSLRGAVFEPPPRNWKECWQVRYGLAVLLVILATLLRLQLGALGLKPPYITYYPAIVLTAWLCGFGPCLVATALSTAISDSFFIYPDGASRLATLGDVLAEVFFFSSSTALSLLGGWRRRAARDLVQRSDALSEAQQVSELGSWEWVVATDTSTWSEEMFRIFGLSPQERAPSYADCPNIFTPESWERLRRTREISLQGGEPFDVQLELMRPDGTTRWVAGRGVPQLDSAGKVVRIHGTAQDITNRKRTEDQLREALLYSRSLIEASPDPLVTISREGKITDVNQATVQATGAPRESLIGSDFSEYFTEPDQARQGYQRVFETGAVRDYPLAIRHHSGRVMPVLYNATLFRNPQGEVQGVFAAARDITQLRTLEEQLLQAKKLEAVGRLAGGVAHEFNNQLTVINGFSDLVLARMPDLDPVRASIEEVRRAGERAASLTRQLLAFSRKQVLQPKVMNLNGLISDLSRMLARLIGANIELVLHMEPDLGLVKADRVQIEQVLMNLVVNARDAMPKGGLLTIGTANVNAARDGLPPGVPGGEYVMLSVTDSGIGMDEETQSHLFEPFFTTKKLGTGTGLGLSIIYGIVQQSGGHIWVLSRPGQGSIFKICLPRVFDAAEERLADALEPAVTAPIASETILVVDDETALAEMTKRVLEDAGYKVLVASSADRALALSRSHGGPIHLLLADVVLGKGMNGIELSAVVKRERPATEVIYMSGYSAELVSRSAPGEEGSCWRNRSARPVSRRSSATRWTSVQPPVDARFRRSRARPAAILFTCKAILVGQTINLCRLPGSGGDRPRKALVWECTT